MKSQDQLRLKSALKWAKRFRKKSLPLSSIGFGVYHHGQFLKSGVLEEFTNNKGSKKKWTLYLTLEPSPIRLKSLQWKNIHKVILALKDPSLKGSGIRWMKSKGLLVEIVPVSDDFQEFYQAYFFYKRYNRPRVVLKIAQSLDGSINEKKGLQTAITGKKSQLWVHQLREASDAILVGGQTVRVDNPELSARLFKAANNIPDVIVLSKSGKLPKLSKILKKSPFRNTLIFTQKKTLISKEAKQVQLSKSNPVKKILNTLKLEGHHSLMVEGGKKIIQLWLNSGYWDQLYILTGHSVLPRGEKWNQGIWKIPLKIDKLSPIGEDFLAEIKQTIIKTL